MNKKIKIIISSFVLIIFSFVLSVFIINYKVQYGYNDKIFSVHEVKQNKVGLVFGAGVKNNTPSDIYKDRLNSAIIAYKTGKISKILVSGDNGSNLYDEITPAKIFLFFNGVKKEDIFLDYAGFDTYDSVYRAKAIFGNTSLTLFSQTFHLKRALYICDGLGIKCVGVETDLQSYLNINYYNNREILARYKAFLNLLFSSKPKYLGDKIDMNGQSNFEK